jgi:hypothetical protein
MKTSITPHRSSSGGYALLIVLLFTTVSMIILGGTMNRTVSTALMNERNNQGVIGTAAAEAATEKVYAQLSSDYILGGVPRISANLSTYQSMYPGSTSGEDAYWNNFSFSNAQGQTNKTYISITSSTNWTWWPNIDSQFNGLGGNVLTYRIISNVRKMDGRFNITNAVQQDIQLLQIPLFQFAIFYNSLLEFSTAATLTINGPVHANGNMYVGSSSALTFNSDIGITGAISKPSWAGTSSGSMSGAINYNGTVTTNTTSLVLPIGTNNTPAAVREIANKPPAGEDVGSSMGQQRYYNKAQFNIIVSNSSVSAWIKRVDPISLTTNSSTTIPWTSLTNFMSTNSVKNFYDQREGTYVGLAQIDIGKYNTWARTNTSVINTIGSSGGVGLVPNDIWIADYRTTNSTTGLYGIRLTNGAAVPTNNYGLTIATPNPLYVIGNYNVTNAGAGVNTLGTTNTYQSQPCSFICDGLTILSQNWQDTYSTNNFSSPYTGRIPVDTTVNAAIVAGVVYSTGSGVSQFSGVHNLPRLLEYWSNNTLTLNTSIVNLYNSVQADGLFIYPGQSGTYYYPPTRKFNFDVRLKDPAYQPPGTPMLSTPRRAVWSTPPPGTTNFTGI